MAIANGNLDILMFLINLGAFLDVRSPAHNNQLPLELAQNLLAETGMAVYQSIVNLLKEKTTEWKPPVGAILPISDEQRKKPPYQVFNVDATKLENGDLVRQFGAIGRTRHTRDNNPVSNLLANLPIHRSNNNNNNILNDSELEGNVGSEESPNIINQDTITDDDNDFHPVNYVNINDNQEDINHRSMRQVMRRAASALGAAFVKFIEAKSKST